MISAVFQAAPPATEPAVTDPPLHWLHGRYFVPMPDLSSESLHLVSKGRAWPALTGILSVLHDLERRGTKQQRAAAKAGRIEHLGVNGLAASIGMTAKAVLRQLRVLESIGLIRTTQAAYTNEVDPVTGRITRNYAKAPPKFIEITVSDRHCRPTGAGRRPPQRDTVETTPRIHEPRVETTPRNRRLRDRNDRVPRERTLQRVRSSGTNRRRDDAGPLERPATPAAQKPVQRADGHDASLPSRDFDTDPAIPSGIAQALGLDAVEVAATPPGERREELIRRFYAAKGYAYDPATKRARFMTLCARAAGHGSLPPPEPAGRERDTKRVLLEAYVAACAKTLGMDRHDVIELGKADKSELVRRLEAAGADPTTGRVRRRHDGLPTHHEPQDAAAGPGPAGDTPEQQDAAEGLRKALGAMSPDGRERARELGEQIAQDDQEAAELLGVIEAKREQEREAKQFAARDMAELAAAKDREDRKLADLRSRLGSAALRQGAG